MIWFVPFSTFKQKKNGFCPCWILKTKNLPGYLKKILRRTSGGREEANSPPICLDLRIVILQFEILSLMKSIFFLVNSLNYIFLLTVACKIRARNRLKSNSKAESFYHINTGSSIITLKVCQIISVMKTWKLVFPEKWNFKNSWFWHSDLRFVLKTPPDTPVLMFSLLRLFEELLME